jgi:hypothetical protein
MAAACASSATLQVTLIARCPAERKPFGRRAQRVLVYIDKNDGGASLGECLRGREPDAGARAGDKGDLILKIINRIHSLVSSLMYVGLDSGHADGAPHSSSFSRIAFGSAQRRLTQSCR